MEDQKKEEEKKERKDHTKKKETHTTHKKVREHSEKKSTKSTKSTTRHHKSSRTSSEKQFSKPIIALIAVAVVIVVINQIQLTGIASALGSSSQKRSIRSGSSDLSGIDITQLKSTAHTIAAVFPVEEFSSAEDAMAAMFPTGTPEYGEALGVSFDDPVGSLATLSKMFPSLKAEVEKNNPEAFQRYVNMASQPMGVSCEYCCGVGPIGADSKGNSRCGCQHNPALLSVTLWLSANTDYSDGEILHEVMRWKTLFFPKNMIDLGTNLAGGDTTALENIPSMVGGC